jgi:hypothetical protein
MNCIEYHAHLMYEGCVELAIELAWLLYLNHKAVPRV